MEDLTWRIIKDYENYMVSDNGLVKNCKTNRILKPETTYQGYFRVKLSNNNVGKKFRIHRLVATAFIENPENKPQVDHIDRNKINNHVHNLRWATNQENQKNKNKNI